MMTSLSSSTRAHAHALRAICAAAASLPLLAFAQARPDTLSVDNDGQQPQSPQQSQQIQQRVTISGGRPSSLPTEIPTKIEGIDAKTMERTINATDAEDALKYLPSLLVRKRYIGDYNHAVLATRAS